MFLYPGHHLGGFIEWMRPALPLPAPGSRMIWGNLAIRQCEYGCDAGRVSSTPRSSRCPRVQCSGGGRHRQFAQTGDELLQQLVRLIAHGASRGGYVGGESFGGFAVSRPWAIRSSSASSVVVSSGLGELGIAEDGLCSPRANI